MNSLLNPNNRLFQLARSGRRLPHIILAIVLSFVFILIAQFTGGVLAVILVVSLSIVTGQVTLGELAAILSSNNPEAVTAHILPDTALEQTLFLILLFMPMFLIIWVWLALFEKRPLWTIGLKGAGGWQKYLRGLLVGLLMFGASIGISAALGYIALEGVSPQPQGLTALGGVLLVFLGWTVQGPAEEALTRGWLLPVIGARYKPLLGVIVSSLIFAAFHSLNFIGLRMEPIFIGLALLNLFLFGLFAALYALYEGSLWGVFSIHAVWNWAQGI
jgi:membrane protease YdiL (CAAX protease family)